MTYRGIVENGVVKLTDGALLPDGDLGRTVESMPCDLPEDLAINHDHDLHGLPKQKP